MSMLAHHVKAVLPLAHCLPRALQVCEGDLAAQLVRSWLDSSYNGGLKIEVRACQP